MTAHARVEVTLDIPVKDVWGSECSVSQIIKQAAESAMDELRRGVSIRGLIIGEPRSGRVEAQIVGEPHVTVVLIRDEAERKAG